MFCDRYFVAYFQFIPQIHSPTWVFTQVFFLLFSSRSLAPRLILSTSVWLVWHSRCSFLADSPHVFCICTQTAEYQRLQMLVQLPFSVFTAIFCENKRRQTNVGLFLVQRLGCWPNNKPTVRLTFRVWCLFCSVKRLIPSSWLIHVCMSMTPLALHLPAG